ncbi:MAG: F0F1 ATP synthase subunit epsilon [Bacteroidales bacterium]|nr:F0F1 ATP synthase subunit epsilon [Bacteroidales bacterium]
MDNKLTLKILTPDGTAFEGCADAVFLPGSMGPFEVLPSHAPIISSLVAGRLRWRDGSGESSVDVRSGAVRIMDNVITVCAEL